MIQFKYFYFPFIVLCDIYLCILAIIYIRIYKTPHKLSGSGP